MIIVLVRDVGQSGFFFACLNYAKARAVCTTLQNARLATPPRGSR
jgi:hypothetical protein